MCYLQSARHELVGFENAAFTEERRRGIVRSTEELAGEALRILGMAFRIFPKGTQEALPPNESVERDLVFAGLVGMVDLPRQEAKQAEHRLGVPGSVRS